MKTNEKCVDAVKMMREIRGELSQEFENMSFEEQKKYMREHANFPKLQET